MFRIDINIDINLDYYEIADIVGYEITTDSLKNYVFTSEESAIDYFNEFLVKYNYSDFVDCLFIALQDNIAENNIEEENDAEDDFTADEDLYYYILEKYNIASIVEVTVI
jgi:hypothetical protein